ncbi:P-loop containing nucleoside triphosphate hydrolase [Phytophthora cactorum]|nr:P-loop containing nucleoside triphosphate hydrolase [Phytophthora cactorum]
MLLQLLALVGWVSFSVRLRRRGYTQPGDVPLGLKQAEDGGCPAKCESGVMVQAMCVTSTRKCIQLGFQGREARDQLGNSLLFFNELMMAMEPPALAAAGTASPPPAPVRRKLDMTDAEDGEEANELPTVYDLMQEVVRLQQAVRDIGDDDPSIFEDDYAARDSYSAERTPPRYRQKIRTASGGSDSFKSGIYSGRKIATNVGNMSPYKNVGAMGRGEFDSSGLKTPPPKRREGLTPAASRTVPRPTRVAALTRENISLLPTPRAQNFTGSVCGSQKSRTSIRTDGGAVFSRLYQPDFYKNREERFKNIRDRRESLDCSFTPRINRRDSFSSRDSIGSGSQASMTSAKTDVVNVSSRLYDPDYVRKRNARLQRMRQEREMLGACCPPVIAMPPRKKPFSGKAKKQQLRDKRAKKRDAHDADDEAARETEVTAVSAPQPVSSGRGDLRTIFQSESKAAIEARKKDATRELVYAEDCCNSQSIYAYGVQDPANQPRILTKPKWSRDMTPEELNELDDRAFKEWGNTLSRRQRTVRTARSLTSMFPWKRMVLVLTKTDLVAKDRVQKWSSYLQTRYGQDIPVLAYSRDNVDESNAILMRTIGQVSTGIQHHIDDDPPAEDKHKDTLTIGFVGEPNVGKSSLLNCLFDRKLVSVSATPGHTKHLQTHYFERVEMLERSDDVFSRVLVCDCPGVVFPRFNVPVLLQILFGSFPIAQTREPFSTVRFIAENCVPHLHEVYKLKPVEDDDDEWCPYTLCESYAQLRGFRVKGGKLDVHRAANTLLRDTLNERSKASTHCWNAVGKDATSRAAARAEDAAADAQLRAVVEKVEDIFRWPRAPRSQRTGLLEVPPRDGLLLFLLQVVQRHPAHRQGCHCDYFEMFKVPKNFNLEQRSIEKTYWNLQKRLHPDLYGSKSEFEKELSAVNAAVINDAYKMLKKPNTRVKYLVREQRFPF